MSFVAPAEDLGFFAHLADKTDIFEGSSMPDSHLFGSFSPSGLSKTPMPAADTKDELSHTGTQQSAIGDDTSGSDEAGFDSKEQSQSDEAAGDDGGPADDQSSEGDPNSSVISGKDKRRRTKEKRKKRK